MAGGVAVGELVSVVESVSLPGSPQPPRSPASLVPIDLQRLAKEHGPQWNWAVIKDLMAQVGTTAPYMQLVLDLKERCAGDEEAVSQVPQSLSLFYAPDQTRG